MTWPITTSWEMYIIYQNQMRTSSTEGYGLSWSPWNKQWKPFGSELMHEGQQSHDVLVYQRGKESTTILSCTATEYSKKIEIFCFAKIYDEFRVSGFWGADYLMQSTNVVKILINILTQTYCTLFTFCSTMWSGCAICIYIWLKVRAAFHSFRSFCIIITLVCINSIKKFSVWYHANKSYFMKIWLQTP